MAWRNVKTVRPASFRPDTIGEALPPKPAWSGSARVLNRVSHSWLTRVFLHDARSLNYRKIFQIDPAAGTQNIPLCVGRTAMSVGNKRRHIGGYAREWGRRFDRRPLRAPGNSCTCAANS
jgi:hypothetical protein